MIVRTLRLAAFSVVVVTATDASADSVAQFLADYPTASRRLDDAYAHVKIVSKHTRFDSGGKLLRTVQCEFLRDGDLLRRVSTRTYSADGSRVGTVTASCAGVSERFIIKKPDAGGPFGIVMCRPPVPPSEDGLFMGSNPVFAPCYLSEVRVADYVRRPTVKVVSVATSQRDGVQMISVDTVEQLQQGPGRSRFYFLPHSWALAGFEIGGADVPSEKSPLQCRVTYVPGSDPPKERTLEYWVVLDGKGDTKDNYEKDDIQSVEFGAISPDEFTLAAFGVEEPAHAQSHLRLIFSLIIYGALFIAAGVWFRVVYLRRRRGA